MSKLIANVDDYDIEEIEKKMELMSSECASRLGEPLQFPKLSLSNNQDVYEINSQEEIKKLLDVTGYFHDGIIKKGKYENDILYLYFEGVWGCDWELWFSGEIENNISSFDPFDFDDPSWWHANIFIENEYIYLVNGYADMVSKIGDCWYIRSKELRYRIMPNLTE
jgi:hypothetical protein